MLGDLLDLGVIHKCSFGILELADVCVFLVCLRLEDDGVILSILAFSQLQEDDWSDVHKSVDDEGAENDGEDCTEAKREMKLLACDVSIGVLGKELLTRLERIWRHLRWRSSWCILDALTLRFPAIMLCYLFLRLLSLLRFCAHLRYIRQRF